MKSYLVLRLICTWWPDMSSIRPATPHHSWNAPGNPPAACSLPGKCQCGISSPNFWRSIFGNLSSHFYIIRYLKSQLKGNPHLTSAVFKLPEKAIHIFFILNILLLVFKFMKLLLSHLTVSRLGHFAWQKIFWTISHVWGANYCGSYE